MASWNMPQINRDNWFQLIIKIFFNIRQGKKLWNHQEWLSIKGIYLQEVETYPTWRLTQFFFPVELNKKKNEWIFFQQLTKICLIDRTRKQIPNFLLFIEISYKFHLIAINNYHYFSHYVIWLKIINNIT